MKFLVTVAFGAGIFVIVCNAYCFSTDNKVEPGKEPKGCFYRKKMYSLNSQFRTTNCLDCTCKSDGNMDCCSAYGTPVNYDKERCHFKFDQQACMYKLIPNEDPTKQCESYGMVG
ncbi:beta-microseminoprotein-like [Rhinoderma darwinii]|uniref:beta-microseminoprotein-like n=1 Tax=Rhinoderma darwinii TaxID=43563 RepID=UPI003F67783D